MARYMKVAKDASTIADNLLSLLPEDQREVGAILITRLFNMGVRVSPRPVMTTVRLNAVCEAVKNLPVVVRMEQVSLPPRPGYAKGMTYNALRVTGKSGTTLPETDEPDTDE